jgi:CubicO group peptidase (beta-lactamase class C family)
MKSLAADGGKMKVFKGSATIGFVLQFVLWVWPCFGQPMLSSGTPESVGMDSHRLAFLDSAIVKALDEDQMPGAVLLVARKHTIVFRKAYGDAQQIPEKETMTVDKIFDMASVTKPVATATAVMILAEEGRLRLMDPVRLYIPEYTNYVDSTGHEAAPIRLYHLLTHTSGLPPYTNAQKLKEEFGEPCPDAVIQKIARISKNHPPGEVFDYSCLGFITLAEIVHRVSGQTIDEFSRERIFKPLGMQSTMFCPSEKFLSRIAPTEVIDGKPLRGKVHDPLAQLMDGKSGNAGLFSTVDDLAVFAQMLLNGGAYGGVQILAPLTVQAMTTVYPSLTFAGRGLGWDINSDYASNLGDVFPIASYGHTGFTGTSICIDPGTQTFVILLTNRVHLPQGNVIALRSKVANIVASSIVEF